MTIIPPKAITKNHTVKVSSLLRRTTWVQIDNFADRIADAENALQNLEQQKRAAEVEVAKPFAQEEELAEKSARLAELNALLNIDRSSAQDSPEKTEETPTTRPSVLAALGEKSNQPEPVKPFRSYYDKDGDAR